MFFSNLFSREIYIRLTKDCSAVACTVRRGLLPAKSTEYPVGDYAALDLQQRAVECLAALPRSRQLARRQGVRG
jgi:hypothetical protein